MFKPVASRHRKDGQILSMMTCKVVIHDLQSSALPVKDLFLQHEITQAGTRSTCNYICTLLIQNCYIIYWNYDSILWCNMYPNQKAFFREPWSLTALEREHAGLVRVFFLSLLLYLPSCHQSICTVASLLHWLWKWGWKKKGGLQNLGLEKINELTWARIKNRWQSGCITWGKAWITVSSRARIPTAIFKSFNTKKQEMNLIRTGFYHILCVCTVCVKKKKKSGYKIMVVSSSQRKRLCFNSSFRG